MKLVDEFEHCGNLDELESYHKRATELDNKLVAAMARIDQFNLEEVAFKWEESFYPKRKQVCNLLSI
jgi:dynein heavy chain